MGVRRSILTAVSGVCVLASASAHAQSGVEAGSLDINAGLRLELGVDSNPFYSPSDASPVSSGLLQINPRFSVRTREPHMVALDASLGAKWEQYLSQGSGASDTSGLDLDGGLGVRLNPQGVVSLRPSDQITWSNEPGYNPNSDPIQALYNRFALELALHPGGADRGSRLGVSGDLKFRYDSTRYNDENDVFDNDGIGGELTLRYNFLPKTAVFLNASVMAVGYKTEDGVPSADGTTEAVNSDSLPIRAIVGFNGLLAPRLSLMVAAGYGGSAYDLGESLTTFVGQVDLGAHLAGKTQLHVGWERNFRDTLVANYATFHRLYLTYGGSAARLNYAVGANTTLSTYSESTDANGDSFQYWEDERKETLVQASAEVSYTAVDWLTVGVRYQPTIRLTDAAVSSGLTSSDLAFGDHRAFAFVELHDVFQRPTGSTGISGVGPDRYGLR